MEVPQILFIWSGKISGANIDWRLQDAVGKFVQLPVLINTHLQSGGCRYASPDHSPAEFGTIRVDLHNAAGGLGINPSAKAPQLNDLFR